MSDRPPPEQPSPQPSQEPGQSPASNTVPQPPQGYPASAQGPYYAPTTTAYRPRDYATPPTSPGQPWQIVPLAEGSLWQAWFSVSTRFTRQNIASWAQASKNGWPAWSIVTYLAIMLLPYWALTSGGAIASLWIGQNLFSSSSQVISALDVQLLRSFFIVAAVVLTFLVPLFCLGSLYMTIFFWALFMPRELGTLRERMRRVIKPYTLILPTLGLISFATFVLVGVITAIVGSTFHLSGATTGSAISPSNISLLSLGATVFSGLTLATSVYTYTLTLQAGSVGTTLSRLAVFGISLLAGLVFVVIIVVIFFVILAILGANFHIQTTGSVLLPIM